MSMKFIEFRNVDISLPIFNATSRSLSSKFLNVATGGKLDTNAAGRISVTALSNLDFKVSSGDRVGLIGHNGAGKSTLLRALSGVYSPTKGSISRNGNIGSLIDVGLGINAEATGRENIYIRGTLLGLSKTEIDARMEEIISFSELGDFVNMPVRTYSSGMHLRLAFSVSTVVRPEILLMDEWLSVGDEGFRHKAEERLREMVDATEILVIASHSRELLESVCNRVIWLEHGEIKMDGPADNILGAYFS